MFITLFILYQQYLKVQTSCYRQAYLLYKQHISPILLQPYYISDHRRRRRGTQFPQPPRTGGYTMSWLARSFSDHHKSDNNDVEEEVDNKQYLINKNRNVSTDRKDKQQFDDANSPRSPGRGVKEDLSEITKTLTHQFWGVASLLAPPLPSGHSDERSGTSVPEAMSGVRRDFAEIGGRFRSGICKLSDKIDVSEITNFASNLLQLESEDDDDDSTDGDGDGDDAVGVTDDVVAFASDIAMHPETWLDFPLPEDEADEDFDLSDDQQEHVLAVERLAPRLRALRIELCPGYMSESSFWEIYFVLLHPRLDRHAAELLSTPKILKSRALLAHELKNRSYSAIETVNHPIKSDEVQIIDKSVIQEDSHESLETDINIVAIPIENGEDLSFSDLEDDEDDDGNIPIHYKKATCTSDSSTKGPSVWVQLNQSCTDLVRDNDSSEQVSVHNPGTKESNDWLDIVNIDVA